MPDGPNAALIREMIAAQYGATMGGSIRGIAFANAEAEEAAMARVLAVVREHEGQALAEAQKRIAELQSTVIAFAAPWAAQHARDRGLPDGHLYPAHYDLLAQCGARMASFTRAKIAKEKPE